MRHTHTLIVGAGQAGLAMSHCLSERGIDNVVLERGRPGERWRSERRPSLRLLTPNWQCRLPGHRYQGPDPDGYMTMAEVAGYLEDYAQKASAPVEEHSPVRSVVAAPGGYRVSTPRGDWSCRNLVVATGECGAANVPPVAAALSTHVHQLVAGRYRQPEQLPPGGVLVVGASASGAQIADELCAAGRRVVLSVSAHTRLPRLYRGRDILFWLDALGILDETTDQAHDPESSRRQPSFQLVGRPDHASLDLGILQARGVRLVGSTLGADGTRLHFRNDLSGSISKAEERLARVLARIETMVARAGLAGEVAPAEALPPVVPRTAPAELDLVRAGISSVVWATGYHQRYPWLHVPVTDGRGAIRHRGGVTDAPGLYVLGLRFQRRRNSSFLSGVGTDALELAAHVAGEMAIAA